MPSVRSMAAAEEADVWRIYNVCHPRWPKKRPRWYEALLPGGALPGELRPDIGRPSRKESLGWGLGSRRAAGPRPNKAPELARLAEEARSTARRARGRVSGPIDRPGGHASDRRSGGAAPGVGGLGPRTRQASGRVVHVEPPEQPPGRAGRALSRSPALATTPSNRKRARQRHPSDPSRRVI